MAFGGGSDDDDDKDVERYRNRGDVVAARPAATPTDTTKRAARLSAGTTRAATPTQIASAKTLLTKEASLLRSSSRAV